ncbi:SDR family NAD(P)-dependent oxidoreductase [Streptosporangium sandarakinum]
MNSRLNDLEPLLLGLDGVLDGVVLRRTPPGRLAEDGPGRPLDGGGSGPTTAGTAPALTVAYPVAAHDADLGELRERIAEALAGHAAGAVATVPVRRVPRTGDGEPDLAALTRIPVPAAEALDAFAARWGVRAEPVPVGEEAPRVVLADDDAPARATGTDAAPDTPDGADGADGAARPSLAEGPPLERLAGDPETVTQAIVSAAERFPHLGVRAVTRDGDIFVGYPELLRRGRRILGGMREHGMRPGSPAILLVPGLTDYFPAVWACVLGGVTCVTVTAPSSFDDRHPVLDKLMHAWRALGRPPIITDDASADGVAGLAALYGEPELNWLSVAELEISPESDDVHPARPSDVAIMALSSGSTGASKVIPVTHRAIVENALSARQVDLVRPGETSFNWLPFDHVAPLVMYLLRDVVLGCDGVHAPTGHIAEQPLRWLDVLSRYGVHHTWSANFAYRLVADALRDLRRDGGDPTGRWDLSSVRTMLNAGEQCLPAVMRDFLAQVAPLGIDERAVVHMWGMAETATGATCKFFAEPASVLRVAKSSLNGTLRLAGPGDAAADCLEFMSMGPAAPGADLRVADDEGRVLPEGVIGRFQVRSARVTPGYLDDPAANAEAFTADGWFDTGDLAFMLDGEVVISGRAKELIVINGEKYYCHEIEDLVGGLDGVASGLVAACGVPDPATGSEVLAVFFVPRPAPGEEAAGPGGRPSAAVVETVERVHRAVAERIRLTAAHALPITEAEFPRTTSGKIQRAALVRRMESGDFDEPIRAIAAARGTAATVPDCLSRPVWRAAEPRPVAAPVADGVTVVFADDLGLAAALEPPGPVVVVRPGPHFSTLDDGGYTIDPASAVDWYALRDALRLRRTPPATLLYLWSYLPAPDPAGPRERVEEALRRCGRDLLTACRTFLSGRPGDPRLVTVSRGLRPVTGEEDLCYPAAQAALLGAVAGRENPASRACHVDLAGASPAEDARDLLAALSDHAAGQGEVAWRRGRPYTVQLEPLTGAGNGEGAGATGTGRAAGGRDALRRGGRYLVTGGAGGVGAPLVASLADRYGARFLLVGRRDPERDAALRTVLSGLAVPGRDVRYRSVDVRDAEALERAAAEAEAAWGGPLDGVLHLAGDYRFRPIAEEDPADWEPIRQPKVTGLLNLADLVRRRPGARLVTFSSLLGHLASAGCAAYGAGNAFADAFTEHLVARAGVTAHSLAWGLWRGLGVNEDNPYEAAAVQRGVLSLPADQGHLLTRVLLRRPPGVLYAGLNPRAAEIRTRMSGTGPLERLSCHSPGLPGEPLVYTDPFGATAEVVREENASPADGDGSLTPVESAAWETLRQTMTDFTGQPVQPGDRLYELGVSSIQLLQLRARLEAALGVDVPNAALFEQPTLLDLACSLTR